jgi:putative hemolysin
LALVITFVGSLFAAGDAALAAMPEARLRSLVEPASHSSNRDLFARFVDNRLTILSSWLVGRVIAIGSSTALIAEAALAHVSPPVAVLVAVLGAVITYGLFTETLSVVARRRPERASILALRLLRPLELLVSPLAFPLAAIGRLVDRRLPGEAHEEARFTESEVEWVVSEGEKAGSLDGEPAEMIRNVLEFKELTAKEVMVPRRHIAAFVVTTPLHEVIDHVVKDGHSRYPVYRESLDNIVGLLYVKDLFEVLKDNRVGETTLQDLVRRPILFVIEAQPVADVLREMRARRLHLALVTDEFGGTSGIVTLEDVLEEIVGEIQDEYDVEAGDKVQDLGDGRVMVDASLAVTDLEQHLGKELPKDDAFESVGGLVMHRAGRVPEVGTKLTFDHYDMFVREADAKHVIKVELVPIPPSDKPPTIPADDPSEP